MAGQRRDELGGVLSEKDLDRCANFIRVPGISVVRDAKLALEVGGCTGFMIQPKAASPPACGSWRKLSAWDCGSTRSGEILPAEQGRWLRGAGATQRELSPFSADEVTRLFR